jgi:hypothetical protein
MAQNALPRSVRWLPEEAGWRRFELTSRGDRVVVRLIVPGGAGPHALAAVLADDSTATTPIEGCATLTLDLPLLGGRSSPKWTERLVHCLTEGPGGAADRALLGEFVNQAATDVSAALDVCAGLPEIGARAGLLGLGSGALVAARLREGETRFSVFVLSSEGLAPELDPSAGLPGEPPCSVAANPAEAAALLRGALA